MTSVARYVFLDLDFLFHSRVYFFQGHLYPNTQIASAIDSSSSARTSSAKASESTKMASKNISKLAENATDFIMPEMNLGQMVHELERVAGKDANVHLIGKIGGVLHTPEEILEKIKEVASKKED